MRCLYLVIPPDINNLVKGLRKRLLLNETYPCPLFLKWGLFSSLETLACATKVTNKNQIEVNKGAI
jgi:hypothetical protein